MTRNDLLSDSGATPSVPASEEAICLFAFAETSCALDRRPPEATLERRLVPHRVGSVAALSPHHAAPSGRGAKTGSRG
jgi:hypothetical protein